MTEQEAHDILLNNLGKNSWDTNPLVQQANAYLASINKWWNVISQVLFELIHQDLVKDGIEHECELGGFNVK
jgi:hypothetical protein